MLPVSTELHQLAYNLHLFSNFHSITLPNSYSQVLTDTHPKVQSAGQMALQEVLFWFLLNLLFI